MKEQIGKFIKWMGAGFDAHTIGGASGRKLSAFWMIVILTSTIELTWLKYAVNQKEWSMLTTVIGLNLGFAAAAFGMTSYQNNKIIERGGADPNKPKEEEKVG
jgi:hypothetical protein